MLSYGRARRPFPPHDGRGRIGATENDPACHGCGFDACDARREALGKSVFFRYYLSLKSFGRPVNRGLDQRATGAYLLPPLSIYIVYYISFIAIRCVEM